MLKQNEIVIYTAGKTWSAEKFKLMRDRFGYNINAHWIDIKAVLSSPEDTHDYENTDFNYLEKMWDHGCKMDACTADMAIIYASKEDRNMHSGSLVEIGHMTASYALLQIQKPVYLIGSCESFEKVGNSDRGWTHQRVFNKIGTDDLVEGFAKATNHYIENYFADWIKWRVYLSANENIRAMINYCDDKATEAIASI